MHFLNNMITLFFFGRLTEQIFGPCSIFYIYLMGALTGGIMSYKIDIKKKKYKYNLGASGSCFGLVTYFVLNFPR